MGKISVACCQLALRVGEAEHNRALSAQAIRRAAQRGANVIVLPELVNSGYVFRDKAEALTLAEAEDGPSLSLWGALARELDVAIVAGFCERLPDGEVANSAALIDAQGVRAIYRKAHLWHEESTIFTAGDRPPPVIETRFGRLAVMICYDLEFPEWVRLPAAGRRSAAVRAGQLAAGAAPAGRTAGGDGEGAGQRRRQSAVHRGVRSVRNGARRCVDRRIGDRRRRRLSIDAEPGGRRHGAGIDGYRRGR